MIASRNLGFVAAAATLLAAAPLSSIFQRWTWLIQAAIAVAVVAAVAALIRALRAPLWAQVVGMLAGLLLALTWLFPAGDELVGILPTPDTLAHFGELLQGSTQDMRSYGVKVPDTTPLLFITVLGVGGVAVLVDVLAVGLRRPALAGLPMLAIYSVPVAVYVDSVPALPFVVGACGYLWLLVTDNVERVRRFGRRFTGEGRDVDVWEASPLAAAGRRLAVVGVALAVALPLAVPGMTGGLLNQFTSAGDGTGTGRFGQGGSPGRIDLFAALSGQLNQSEVAEMVKVTTTEPSPFYLRFGVADELRSDGFRVRPPTGTRVDRDLPGIDRRGADQQRYRATVEVSRNLEMPLVPVYSDPVGVQGLNGNWLYDRNLGVVFSNRDNSRGKRYTVEYVRSTFTPAALRRAPSLPAEHPIAVQQTRRPSVQQVDALVAELIEGKRTDYDKVRAIYDHFSRENGFSYSLSTRGGTSGQEIVDFLDNKVGFCQQYAAAMAWLVRAAGIPARVAFGFTNGTSTGTGSFVLTNRNLHAWTEVYFDGMGWVPFDPTPAYAVQGATRSAWAPDSDAPDPEPSGSSAPGVTPEGPDTTAGPQQPDAADRDVDETFDPVTGAPIQRAPTWPWWTAGGVLALLALLCVPALRRMALRRRRQLTVTPAVTAGAADAADAPATGMLVLGGDRDRARADAHAAWDELVDTLVDYQVRVDRTETPRATAERLVREALAEDATSATAVRLLGRAEERARYARDPLTGEPLRPALASVRDTLAARADRRTRLLAVVLPPSVLMRWRSAVTEHSTRWVTTTGRLRLRLARWNPRRLLARRA
ncbi:DUF3488 and transglutaminase-like domain-containing protein [Micromonospora sp. KC213]|uniref:transglutaminase TgpA family protein n=1 Tax=Micromonospora sp. KC213 TaxID=2530378 RepID=UPI001045B85B|nr:DUF3488 and transglutaminase-like domain-containing protein [Micromonospora sp. KC213]TDC35440.1 transglutaminase domain-containing protein [Micromonospora sp. KC213]